MLAFEPHHGLTHVIDKGLGPRGWEDVLEMAGDHISIIKLGWGTAAVTQNLERKLDVLRGKPTPKVFSVSPKYSSGFTRTNAPVGQFSSQE